MATQSSSPVVAVLRAYCRLHAVAHVAQAPLVVPPVAIAYRSEVVAVVDWGWAIILGEVKSSVISVSWKRIANGRNMGTLAFYWNAPIILKVFSRFLEPQTASCSYSTDEPRAPRSPENPPHCASKIPQKSPLFTRIFLARSTVYRARSERTEPSNRVSCRHTRRAG